MAEARKDFSLRQAQIFEWSDIIFSAPWKELAMNHLPIVNEY